MALALNGGDADDSLAAALAQPAATAPPPPPAAQAAPADATSDATALEPPAPPGSAEADSLAPPAAAALAPTTPEPPLPAAPASPLTGFVLPVEGGCVPESELLLPGARRTYRNGTHEGMDIYSEDVGGCPGLTVDTATPIFAAKAGVVVRANWAYQDLTQADFAAAAAAGFQGEAILDMFRGRQVEIDHGGGIVTRYAHLSAIAAGIEVGRTVQAGEIIAFAGESGTPESFQAPGTDIHGHFEIRVGDGYLGQGLVLAEARLLYLEAFGLDDSAAAGP